MSDIGEINIENLQHTIGCTFNNKELLTQALTHSSYANEQRLSKNMNNERLEFLGDAVLEVVSSEVLYLKYPDMQEGKLSKKRASLVCEQALAASAKDIGLGEYLLLGRGEELGGGREKASITSDAVEALIGAIYLDQGMDVATKFINQFILNDIENKSFLHDSKTVLQEVVQQHWKTPVTYELIDTEGPENERLFVMQVAREGNVLGIGRGKTKQAAGQDAAYHALVMLKEKLGEDFPE